MTKQEQLADIAAQFTALVSTALLRDGSDVQQTIAAIRNQADAYGLTDAEVQSYIFEHCGD